MSAAPRNKLLGALCTLLLLGCENREKEFASCLDEAYRTTPPALAERAKQVAMARFRTLGPDGQRDEIAQLKAELGKGR